MSKRIYGAVLLLCSLCVTRAFAGHPWPKADRAPDKASGEFPDKPTRWRVHHNEDALALEREWRDESGKFAVVSRQYEIPLDNAFLESEAYLALPMQIQERLIEPVLLYRAYFVGDGKYHEIPTPLAYTFDGAAGYAEMWSKRDNLKLLQGVSASGDKYHKQSGDLSGLAAAFAGSSDEPDFRRWTDATGKHTIDARFIGANAGKVTLEKRDGSRVTLPLERLSEEDQAWVKAR